MNEPDKMRTSLANERTLLAYIRTALAMLVFAMAAIKFFPENPAVVAAGWLFMAGGVLIFLWGLITFYKVSKFIQKN